VKTTFKAQIRQLPTDSLIAYVNNVKQHPEAQIAKIISSIAEFGFTVPIVVDSDRVVIAGHGRLAAAQKMQLKQVPCIVRDDLTPAQVKALRIADNKVAESPWDDAALKLELEALAELDFDLTLTGWDAVDLTAFDLDVEFQGSQLFGGGQGEQQPCESEDEEAVADLVEQAEEGAIVSRVKPGEIWQLGRHQLCCGDSTDEATVKRLLGNRTSSLGMVWADAPYGISIVSKDGSVGGGTKGKYKPIAGDDTKNVAYESFQLCNKLFKCPQIFWGANHFASVITDSPCWIVWDKQDGKSVTFADCELAWTNIDQPARVFKHIWDGFRRDSERGEMRVHPTQKPVALAEWAFEKYGKPNDLIFDPFLGSGMSLIAAERMGDRTCYGLELSPDYCEVIIQRWEKLTGQTAQLLHG
jgi:hypothetical protein